MSDGGVQVHLIIAGRVQGVFYRATTQEQARGLGLTGWVRNCPDGTVEAVAEGPADTVDLFVEWCHQGPPAARVAQVVESPLAPIGSESDFSVRL